MAKWIEDESRNLQIKLAPGIAQLLADYLGNDLSRISNELNKMKLVLKEGEVLDGKLVETHIGISKEFNVFELQKSTRKKKTAIKPSKLRITWEKSQNQSHCHDHRKSL